MARKRKAKKAKKAKARASPTKKRDEAAHGARQGAAGGPPETTGPVEIDTLPGPLEADERPAAALIEQDDGSVPSEEELRELLGGEEDFDDGGH